MDKLPKGWKKSTIGEVCTKVTDGTHKTPHYTENGVPFLSVKDVTKGFIDFSNTRFITKTEHEELTRRCKPEINDILYTKVGTTGVAKVIDTEKEFSLFVSLALLKPNKRLIESYFFEHQLNSPSVYSQAQEKTRGVANRNLVITDIKSIQIALPPLPEQTRIVNKLDRLFKRIDKSIALLEENIKHTETLMASVLDEIFSKINAKRFQVKALSKNIQYGYTGKALDKGEYYYLRITDIQNGKVNYSNTPYSDIPKSQVDKYVLKHGDILFARTGATAGKSYLFNDNEKSVFASYLIRVVCNEKVLIPNYLYCFFQSKGYWDQIFGNIVGAAQPNFNGKKLGEIIVPLPDIITQQKIIEKFESLTKYFEQITIQQQSKLSYLKALKASLLDKAFKGEL